LKIIESSKARAEYVSRELGNGAVVLHGDALDKDILTEANVASCQTVVAVTNDDETNIFASVLAKREGAGRAITLVNKSVYEAILPELGIDVVVSPNSITISSILRHVRPRSIAALYTLRENFGEVIEAVARSDSGLGSVENHRELMTAAERWIIAPKLASVLSLRMAMRLNSLSLQKKFSTRCRHLYISVSMASGFVRRECWEMTIMAPRSFSSRMIQLESKALSAMRAAKETPSISGATPTVSWLWPGNKMKRTRLPKASVSARSFVVIPPLDLPMA
jgi:hypothetical protein